MKFALLCAAVLAAAAPAMADEVVASNGNDSVRLSDSPCSNQKVMEQVPPPLRERLHGATAQISGQAFQACWVIDGQTARLVYEDGDEGLVPLSEFKKPA